MSDPVTDKREKRKCDECESNYFADSSQMSHLCPECAHYLYGYPQCEHNFSGNRCTKCGWDGSRSEYLHQYINSSGRSPLFREHRARITWSAEQEREGLPNIQQGIDPSWLDGVQPAEGETWSLLYRFDRPPREQGNPTESFVRFLVNEAPHSQLSSGITLWLFERMTGKFAKVEILD